MHHRDGETWRRKMKTFSCCSSPRLPVSVANLPFFLFVTEHMDSPAEVVYNSERPARYDASDSPASLSESRMRMLYFLIKAWKLARCMPVSSALLVAFQSFRLSASSTNSFSIFSTDFSRASFLTCLSSSP